MLPPLASLHPTLPGIPICLQQPSKLGNLPLETVSTEKQSALFHSVLWAPVYDKTPTALSSKHNMGPAAFSSRSQGQGKPLAGPQAEQPPQRAQAHAGAAAAATAVDPPRPLGGQTPRPKGATDCAGTQRHQSLYCPHRPPPLLPPQLP